MEDRPAVVAICPVYDEKRTVRYDVKAVIDFYLKYKEQYTLKKVIVIDDCSTDGSGEEVLRLKEYLAQNFLSPDLLDYARLPQNHGKAFALVYGYSRIPMNIDGNAVIKFFDTDLIRYTPEHVKRELDAITKQENVIMSCSFVLGNIPFIRRWRYRTACKAAKSGNAITGQRSLRKATLDEIMPKDPNEVSGYGLETYISKKIHKIQEDYAVKNPGKKPLIIACQPLPGVIHLSHMKKEPNLIKVGVKYIKQGAQILIGGAKAVMGTPRRYLRRRVYSNGRQKGN